MGGRQLLKIELEHSTLLEIFDISIDLPTIKGDPVFGPAFSSLEEFKDAVLANFETVEVTE